MRQKRGIYPLIRTMVKINLSYSGILLRPYKAKVLLIKKQILKSKSIINPFSRCLKFRKTKTIYSKIVEILLNSIKSKRKNKTEQFKRLQKYFILNHLINLLIL